MKKRILCLLLAAMMVLSLAPVSLAADGTLSGTGTADDPYLIADAADLAAFRDLVNTVTSADDAARTACARLTADIDLSGIDSWTPISTTTTVANQYGGSFDGDGCTISGLTIVSTEMNQGLFGGINGAVIENLKVSGDVCSEKNYVGGIVGKMQAGTIRSCSFSGSVSTAYSSGYAGGITSYINTAGNTISGCVNHAAVYGWNAGGIIGNTTKSNTIENCYNTGTINAGYNVAGIAGQLSSGSITNCFNVGAIVLRDDADSTPRLGGIFGFSGATVTNCWYTLPEASSNLGGTSADGTHTDTITADMLGEAFVDGAEYPMLSWEGPAVPQAPKATVTFTVTPTEALVTLNGKAVKNGSVSLAAGSYEYTVTAAGYRSVSGTVTVSEAQAEAGETVSVDPIALEAKQVTGLTVSGYKDSYAVGEELTGLVVTAVYDNDENDTAVIAEGYTVSGFDSSAAAEALTVTVSYSGQTADFTVSVVEPTGVLSTLAGKMDVDSTAAYTFVEDEEKECLASNNKGVGNSDATLKLTALKAGLLSFEFKTSSEARYDYLNVSLNGDSLTSSNKVGYSGTMDWTAYTLMVSAGDVVTIAYRKDSSGNTGDDTIWLRNFALMSAYEVTFAVSPDTASVTMNGETKAAGSAVFTVVDGSYDYTVSAFGYDTATGTVTVAGDDVTETVTLVRQAGVKLTFDVTMPEGFTNAASVTVTSGSMVMTPEEDGSYLLPAGTYSYTVTADFCIPQSDSVTLDTEAVTVPVTLQETPLAVLRGKMSVEEGSYSFVADTNGHLASNNQGKNSSQATLKLTALQAGRLSFDYSVSSESNYDWLEIKVNGSAVTAKGTASGTVDWTAFSQDMAVGDIVSISYSKDSSGDRYDDTAWLRSLSFDALHTVTFTVTPETATVTLEGETKSAAEASFLLVDGSYEYSVQAFGYETETGTLTVEGDDVSKTAALTKLETYRLTFAVTLPEGVTASPDITMTCDGAAISSEEDGSFLLPPGSYSYTISCQGCDDAVGTVTIEAADSEQAVTLLRKLTVDDFLSSDLAEIANDADYPFAGIYDESGNYLKSTVNVNYKTAAITLTFKHAAVLTFEMKTDSYSSYYGGEIKVNGTRQGSIVGGATDWTTYTVKAQAGDTVAIGNYYYGGYGTAAREYPIYLKNFSLAPLYQASFNTVEGAVIEVKLGDTVMTGSAGLYTLEDGTYTYTVSAFGYESAAGSFTMAGQDMTVDAVLTPLPVKTLSFVLPEGAEVSVSHSVGGSMTPAEDGSYALPAGETYSYVITKAGYEEVSGSVTMTEDRTVTLTLDDLVFIGIAWDGSTKTEPQLKDGVYQIGTAEELAWFADLVNSGTTNASAELTANINLGGKSWTAIGAYMSANSYKNPFIGSLEGNGHIVSGLNSTVGLIERLGTDYQNICGSVANLTVSGTVAGSGNVGGIVSDCYGSIENCAFKGSVSNSSTGSTGGIAGRSYGSIKGCVNYGTIKCTASGYASTTFKVGGIVGYVYYTPVENCANLGQVSVTASNGLGIGGIAGQPHVALVNCYNAGTVSGGASRSAVANDIQDNAVLTNCYYLAGTGTDANATEKTEAEMKAEDFVIALSGDKSGAWNYDSTGLAINGGYPLVPWQGGSPVIDPNAEDVAADKLALTLESEIRQAGSLQLPAEGAAGSAITWTSDKTELISNDGLVTLPESGTETVVLTARIAKGSAWDTREFTLTVYSLAAQRQEQLDDLASKLEGKGLWAQQILHPEETNAADVALRALQEAGADTEGVTITLTDAGSKAYPVNDTVNLAADGTISYFTGVEGSNSFRYAQYNGLVFTLTKGEATATATARLFISWDAAYVQGILNDAAIQLTWESIRTDNTNSSSEEDEDSEPQNRLELVTGTVESNLRLPASIGACAVEWDVTYADGYGTLLEITEEYEDSVKYYLCKVKRPAYEDQPVCLIAAVTYNLLNDGEQENPMDYPMAAYCGYQFTLAMDENATAADPELTQQNLDAKYQGLIRDFVDKTAVPTLSAVTADLQMPTPGTLEDAGILLDRDSEKVTMTSSDESVLVFYGYHAYVYRPLPGSPDKTVSYTVTITDRYNNKVIAEQTFSLTAVALTQAELDEAAALMEQACTEQVYWEGLKGENTGKQSITKNLTPFSEITVSEDGSLTYVRGAANITFGGIDVDDLPGYDAMSTQPWREIRSSDETVISSEQLLVTRPDYDTEVTLDSVLSYTAYAKYWEKFGVGQEATEETRTAYAAFEGFWKQPVSVTVNVKGTLGTVNPASDPVTATVSYTGQMAGAFVAAPALDVSLVSNLAESYGYTDSIRFDRGVSALDALVALHVDLFGDAFTKETAGDYLVVSASGFVSKLFGESTYDNGFMVNGGYPNDGTVSTYGGYNGTTVSTTALVSGDMVEFFVYQDDDAWQDAYSWFELDGSYVDALALEGGETVSLKLKGASPMSGYLYADAAAFRQAGAAVKNAQLALVNVETGAVTAISAAVTDENGLVSLTLNQGGVYYLTAYMPQEEIAGNYANPVFMTLTKVTVTVAGDVNGDGVRNLLDISLLYRVYCGKAALTEAIAAAGDMNGDGIINLRDVATIYRMYQGKR